MWRAKAGFVPSASRQPVTPGAVPDGSVTLRATTGLKRGVAVVRSRVGHSGMGRSRRGPRGPPRCSRRPPRRSRPAESKSVGVRQRPELGSAPCPPDGLTTSSPSGPMSAREPVRRAAGRRAHGAGDLSSGPQPGRSRCRWPAIMRSAGRAKNSYETRAETGLPGRPKTGAPYGGKVENANGFPGLTATCNQRACWPPSSSRTNFTKVAVAHAHPAARQHRVAALHGSLQGSGQGVGLVGGHAQVDPDKTVSPQPGQQ